VRKIVERELVVIVIDYSRTIPLQSGCSGYVREEAARKPTWRSQRLQMRDRKHSGHQRGVRQARPKTSICEKPQEKFDRSPDFCRRQK
jgi:hypothetical protein